MEKTELYAAMCKEARGLLEGESDKVANLANLCALIKERFGFFWIGFYEVKGKELVLGPFQGPVACTRIAFGKGVCGTSWAEKRSIVVQDVHDFPGHIACNASSKSEVVVPIFLGAEVVLVLDIDSDSLRMFDEVDKAGLTAICELISEKWPSWN